MTDKNKKLTDFGNGSVQKSTESAPDKKTEGEIENSDDITVCGCYEEMKSKYQEKIDELDITPPKCGHCIAYLCNEAPVKSVYEYNCSLRFFIESIHLQGVCINNVEFVDVRDYFEDRGKQGLAKSTITRDKSAIKGAISRFEAENKKLSKVSWKISENIDSSNYSTDAKYEREPLQNEEIKQLMAALDDLRDKLMVLTSIETGPRAKATTLIKLPDVNLEKKQIKLKNTKSGGTYIMPLTNELAALLEHWIQNVRTSYIINENNLYLFPSRQGGKLSTKAYNEFVHTAAKEAGIQEKIAEISITGKQREMFNNNSDYRTKWKVDVHALRHTFSRLLKNNDVSKNARIYALDHSRDVTDGYGIDEEASREEIRKKFNGIDISIP
jgi:integrase